MPRRAQTREEHAATRARLIAAARELSNAAGPDAVTLREVARRAGYSPGALYRYFTDVDDLVRSTRAETMQVLREALLAALEGVVNPAGRLRALLLAYGRFAGTHADEFRATFLQPLRKRAPGRPVFDDALAESPFGLLLAEVRHAMRTGALPDGDANRLAQTLWAVVHGVIGLDQTVAHFPFLDRDERLLYAVDVALAGACALPRLDIAAD